MYPLSRLGRSSRNSHSNESGTGKVHQGAQYNGRDIIGDSTPLLYVGSFAVLGPKRPPVIFSEFAWAGLE
jgi:hypothetical protein